MAEDNAKPKSFVRATSIPADAAARSLARTARNRRPVLPRRIFATNVQSPASTSRANNVKRGLSISPLSDPEPKLTPNSDGDLTV